MGTFFPCVCGYIMLPWPVHFFEMSLLRQVQKISKSVVQEFFKLLKLPVNLHFNQIINLY